jgi:hypothetical protein
MFVQQKEREIRVTTFDYSMGAMTV